MSSPILPDVVRRLQSVGDPAKPVAARGGIGKRDEPGILLLSHLKSVGRLMTPAKPRVNITVKRNHRLGVYDIAARERLQSSESETAR